MQVHEVMSREVESVHPEATLQEAAERMRTLDVGFLPVCDQNRVLGVLTDRDITVRATAAGHDAEVAAVRQAMTDSAIFCFETDDVRAAAQLMRVKQVRRLLVLNGEQRLVGVVTLGDLALEVKDEDVVSQTLEAVSEPTWAAQR